MGEKTHINLEQQSGNPLNPPEISDLDVKVLKPAEVKKELSDEIFSESDSDSAAYEPYHCHCCSKKCHDKEKDFLTNPGEEDDPPIIYQPKVTSVDSVESEVRFAAPKCQCANCALKNMCKSRQNNVGHCSISKHFRYANVAFIVSFPPLYYPERHITFI